MPSDHFKVLVTQLLTALGFEENTIEVSPYTGDGRIDVRGVRKNANQPD